MAADVSSLVRLLSGYKDDRAVVVKESPGAKSTALMTRDLLGSGRGGGGGSGDRSLELDLDLQVPSGYEKRLDLKSGKVYLQRCNSTSSSNAEQSNQTVPTFQDLNFPPNSSSSNNPPKPLLNLFDDTTSTLELKLLPSSRSSRPLPLSPNNTTSSNFQSVCTLDKVKSALERAERDPPAVFKKRQSPDDTVLLSDDDHDRTPVAAGCPGCLSYVLVMMNNPKCPRCDTIVPLPAANSNSFKIKKDQKKPKIDLNISI